MIVHDEFPFTIHHSRKSPLTKGRDHGLKESGSCQEHNFTAKGLNKYYRNFFGLGASCKTQDGEYDGRLYNCAEFHKANFLF